MRTESYEDYKKRLGKKCTKCGSLLCPNNSSGLCKACAGKQQVSKRLANSFSHTKEGIKYMEKLKRGFHKFEDLELIEFWGRGWSDSEIAKVLHVSQSVVSVRRYKLGLQANFKPFFGENLNEDQMKERWEKELEDISEVHSRYEDDPHYFNVKRYNNTLKRLGRDTINTRCREDYKELKKKCQRKCSDCGAIISPKNANELCMSCSQKSFSDGEFLALYKKGLNDYVAAKILGVHPPAISRRRRRLFLPSQRELKTALISGNNKLGEVSNVIQVRN